MIDLVRGFQVSAVQREERSKVSDSRSKLNDSRQWRTTASVLALALLCSPTTWAKKPTPKHAQAKQAASVPAKKLAPNPWKIPAASKADLYAGFAYWKPSGTLSNGNTFQAIKTGFTFGGAYYFSKHFGVNADVGIHP